MQSVTVVLYAWPYVWVVLADLGFLEGVTLGTRVSEANDH